MQLGLGLLPIVPLLLLPFIAVFFILVFPLWGIALGVLGLALLVARGIDALLAATGVQARTAPPVRHAFRWVLLWGGLAGKVRRTIEAPEGGPSAGDRPPR